MANRMSGELLSSVKSEIISNMADVRERVDQWLMRPESGGIEQITMQLNEVIGSLLLLQRTHAAQLATKLNALMEHFAAMSVDGLQEILAESSQTIAVAVLVLSDVIDDLDQAEGEAQEMIDDAITGIEHLLRGETQGDEAGMFANVSASNQTLAVLAQEYQKVIDQHCVLIERHLDDEKTPLDFAKLIQDNNELSNIFALLNYNAPQLLLAKINERLAQGKLNEAQWIDIAESMLLVREALTTTLAALAEGKSEVSDYVQAVQSGAVGARTLEVGQAMQAISGEGEYIFSSLRKAYLAENNQVDVEQWRDAAGFCLEAEAFTNLLALTKISQHVHQSGLLFTHLSLDNPTQITDDGLIDLLVGLEYLFHGLGSGGNPNDHEPFLRTTLETLNVNAFVNDSLLKHYRGLGSLHNESEASESGGHDLPLTSSAFADDLDAALDEQDAQGSQSEPEDSDAGDSSVVTDSPLSEFIQAGDVARLRQTAMPPGFTQLLAQQQGSETDEEILEIFNEELDEIVGDVQPLIQNWLRGDEAAIKDIRRAFHTLKGSGRMSGYLALGEFAWQHESLLNRCLDDSIRIDAEIKAIGAEAVQLLALIVPQGSLFDFDAALLTQGQFTEQRLAQLTMPSEAALHENDAIETPDKPGKSETYAGEGVAAEPAVQTIENTTASQTPTDTQASVSESASASTSATQAPSAAQTHAQAPVSPLSADDLLAGDETAATGSELDNKAEISTDTSGDAIDFDFIDAENMPSDATPETSETSSAARAIDDEEMALDFDFVESEDAIENASSPTDALEADLTEDVDPEVATTDEAPLFDFDESDEVNDTEESTADGHVASSADVDNDWLDFDDTVSEASSTEGVEIDSDDDRLVVAESSEAERHTADVESTGEASTVEEILFDSATGVRSDKAEQAQATEDEWFDFDEEDVTGQADDATQATASVASSQTPARNKAQDMAEAYRKGVEKLMAEGLDEASAMQVAQAMMQRQKARMGLDESDVDEQLLLNNLRSRFNHEQAEPLDDSSSREQTDEYNDAVDLVEAATESSAESAETFDPYASADNLGEDGFEHLIDQVAQSLKQGHVSAAEKTRLHKALREQLPMDEMALDTQGIEEVKQVLKEAIAYQAPDINAEHLDAFADELFASKTKLKQSVNQYSDKQEAVIEHKQSLHDANDDDGVDDLEQSVATTSVGQADQPSDERLQGLGDLADGETDNVVTIIQKASDIAESPADVVDSSDHEGKRADERPQIKETKQNVYQAILSSDHEHLAHTRAHAANIDVNSLPELPEVIDDSVLSKIAAGQFNVMGYWLTTEAGKSSVAALDKLEGVDKEAIDFFMYDFHDAVSGIDRSIEAFQNGRLEAIDDVAASFEEMAHSARLVGFNALGACSEQYHDTLKAMSGQGINSKAIVKTSKALHAFLHVLKMAQRDHQLAQYQGVLLGLANFMEGYRKELPALIQSDQSDGLDASGLDFVAGEAKMQVAPTAQAEDASLATEASATVQAGRSQQKQRLHEELSDLADVDITSTISASQETSARALAANLLRALDVFSDQVNHFALKPSAQTLDDLIEATYDLEDGVSKDEQADWLWGLLDAIEQLLLTQKNEQRHDDTQYVPRLRQSAELIEDYHQADVLPQDEVDLVISELLRARTQINARASASSDAVESSADAFDTANEASSAASSTDEANFDYNLVEIFIDEADDIIRTASEDFAQWRENTVLINLLGNISRKMHTLKGSARMLDYAAMSGLAHAIEQLSEAIRHTSAEPEETLFERAFLSLQTMLDQVREDAQPDPDKALIGDIFAYLGETPPAELQATQSVPTVEESAPTTEPASAPSNEKESVAQGVAMDDSWDADLLEIFTDEAQELLNSAKFQLTEGLEKNDTRAGLQRIMHTLKGGARMVGLEAMGTTAHLMESVVDKVAAEPDMPIDGAQQLLSEALETQFSMLDSVLRREIPATPEALNKRLQRFVDDTDGAADSLAHDSAPEGIADETPSLENVGSEITRETQATDDSAQGKATPTPDSPDDSAQGKATPTPDSPDDSAQGKAAPTPDSPDDSAQGKATPTPDSPDDSAQGKATPTPDSAGAADAAVSKTSEAKQFVTSTQSGMFAQNNVEQPKPAAPKYSSGRSVRVDESMLEELTNMVGEANILRSVMENISHDAEFNVGELQRIVTRVDGQMRRLESEAEAQMLFRREQTVDDEYFDPLEMDRFSEMQQLSRQLSEAVDDLKNIQNTLINDLARLRTISVQQSVLHRGVQERLMEVQLVRFDTYEGRLHRLVAQAAKSVDKEVRLVISGGQVEIEHKLLDELLGPLEHIIRNAIAHGIEEPKERIRWQKTPHGVIKIDVSMLLNELMVRVIDDGRGFDYGKIRQKARDKGWLDESRADDEQYLNSLLLRSGFSTAKDLTQLSGRGIGLDVVYDMITKRRGQLQLRSISGKGSEFDLILPSSMSIIEVLQVSIAGRPYAIPMTSVVAVAQMSTEDLLQALDKDEQYYNYHGEDYRVRTLGAYFDRDYEFQTDKATVPVLLVQSSGEHESSAFHIDHVINRLEIVIKNVHALVQKIPGIMGATVLADGSVVPVLDLQNLARRIDGLSRATTSQDSEEEIKVMIVDDSITMRKVGTRLLERNGFSVATAKDGLEALDLLPNFEPNAVLLDIEMPRMDGFEFAGRMRDMSEYDGVPIIMITSRTGDKHRERASEIGVQGYLGKPYNEQELLKEIHTLLGIRARM